MKIRLLMLTVGFEAGGTEGQIAELAVRFDRQRYEVLVCTLKAEHERMWGLRAKGIRVVALGGHGKWDPAVLFRFRELVRDERPDIIHAFLFRANIAARIVGFLMKVPVVLSSYRGVEVQQELLPRWIDRLTRRWSHAITCCSHAVRDAALDRVGGEATRYHTIYNGVDVYRFVHAHPMGRSDIGLQPDGCVVGTVCRLVEPLKGVGHLLEALAKLVQNPALCHTQLLIVGDGPARIQLSAHAARLRLSSCVKFLGARQDVERLLPLMDVFVLPSTYEGFGIAIVEAMASGRPVVATRVGGIPEIIRHNETGILVPPGDPHALALALEGLLLDPHESRRLAAAGQAVAERQFAIETAVQCHQDLYESLMASRVKARGAGLASALN